MFEVGETIHIERPGPCREVTVTAVTKTSVEVDGPIKRYYGLPMKKLLHSPETCPFEVVPGVPRHSVEQVSVTREGMR